MILTGCVEAELARAEGAAEEVRRRVARRATEDVHGKYVQGEQASSCDEMSLVRVGMGTYNEVV